MGKRSREIMKVDEGVCAFPNNNSSKKHKKKRSHNDNNKPETATGDEAKCKNESSEGLNDTKVQSHKKKNKASKNLVDSPSDQEVKKRKKEKEEEKIEGNGEDNNLSLDNESTNKKKKKKRKFKLEVEADAGRLEEPLDIAETKSCKKTKTKPPDYQIDSSENIDSEKIIKKKKKIAIENAEDTVKGECLDAADVDNTKTKIKKKKHQSLENDHEDIQEKSIVNLNQNEETTTKDKKKKKNKDTKSELSVDSGKPVTAKFNAEEAAVTEEEINQFCDEIDEEDNKQYEEWVQLLETMLGPKKHVKQET